MVVFINRGTPIYCPDDADPQAVTPHCRNLSHMAAAKASEPVLRNYSVRSPLTIDRGVYRNYIRIILEQAVNTHSGPRQTGDQERLYNVYRIKSIPEQWQQS